MFCACVSLSPGCRAWHPACALAVVANGSLVVAEINASSAWRPLALMSTCLLSVEIKHGIIRTYLSASVQPRGSAHMHQTHLCAGTEFVLKMAPVW